MRERTELDLRVTAERSGTGPATWGQQAIWDAVTALDEKDAPRYNVCVGLVPEQGHPRPVVLEAIAEVVRHHQALRTRLHTDPDGALRQTLDATGRVPVTVVSAAPEEAERAAAELLADLASHSFDTAADWPLRIGLVETGGQVRRHAVVLSHTAADGGGLRRLARDVVMLLGGTAPADLWERFPATQPLDEAADQSSPRGRRRDAAARRHWRTRLTDGPRRLFPSRAERDPHAPYPHAVLRSPALLRAVDHVSRARGVSGQSVLLAATARQISRIGGSPDVLLQTVVNNRFLPGMAHSVTTLAQEGLFHIRDAGAAFGDLVGRVHAGALAAYRCAGYDKRLLDRDIRRLRAEVPELADHSCFVNDTREPELFRPPAPEAGPRTLAGAREHTALSWPDALPPRPHQSLALDVVDVPGAVELVLVADASLLPRPDMERLLRGVEEAVVEDALASGCP